MLTYDEALNLNYYKKTHFTGWMNPLRFLIKQEKPEEGEPYFHAWVWPGPYIFDKTDDSLKIVLKMFSRLSGTVTVFRFSVSSKALLTIRSTPSGIS